MKKKKNLLRYIFFIVLFVGMMAILFVENMKGGEPTYWENEPLHSTIEALGAFIAIIMAIILFNREKNISRKVFFLALGFFSMGFFDCLHSIFHPGQQFVLMHSIAIFMGGLFFAFVWFPEPRNQVLENKRIPWIVAAFLTLLAVWVIAFPDTFPKMLYSGQFTPIAVTLNVTGGVFFLAASLYFIIDFHRNGKREIFLFACFSLLFGLSGFLFKYSSLWDIGWWLKHLLHLIAYVVVLEMVFSDYLRMVFNLKISILERKRVADKLNASNQQLNASEQQLKVELVERNRAEERAKRFSSLLERSLNEIYVFDSETLRFTEANRGARENIGYTMEELSSMTPLDLKPDFTIEAFNKLIEPLREGKQENIVFNTIHRRKDGTLYPVEIHLQMISNGSWVFVAVILDITKRKMAEDALRESEMKYKLITDNTNDFIAITTFDAKATFLYVSPSYTKILGYQMEELIGKSSIEFIHSDDKKRLLPLLLKYIKIKVASKVTGKKLNITERIEYRIKDKAGKWINLEAVVNIIKDKILYMQRDVTERKKTEDQVNKNLKDLKQFKEVTIGREMRMIELKQEINDLMAELGREKRYD